MLKLPKPHSEEQRAGAVLDYFGAVAAARVYAWDHHAQLIEWLEGGRDLVTMVEQGRDDAATGIIAGVLIRLHHRQKKSRPDGLIPLDRRFASLFARENERPIFGRAAAMVRRLLAEPGEAVVLHGDVHHGNIMRRGLEWVAIDPQGLVGEAAYDLANMLCNPIELPGIVQDRDRALRQATILAETCGLDRQRVLAFAFGYACLSACWDSEDGSDPSHPLAVAMIVEPLACG